MKTQFLIATVNILVLCCACETGFVSGEDAALVSLDSGSADATPFDALTAADVEQQHDSRQLDSTIADAARVDAMMADSMPTDTSASPGVFTLQHTTYVVDENAGQLEVVVERNSGLHGDVTVAYSTRRLGEGLPPFAQDADFDAHGDYDGEYGVLQFFNAEQQQSFNVSIIDDAVAEGPETFEIYLLAATGGSQLGSVEHTVATVTIVDDDVEMADAGDNDDAAVQQDAQLTDMSSRSDAATNDAAVQADVSSGVPTITEVDGRIANGTSVTLTGFAFGSKSPAAPLLWEDFNNGTEGGDIAANTNWKKYTSLSPRYSSTLAYGESGYCAHNPVVYGDSHASKFQTLYQVFSPSNRLYYSYQNRYSGSGGRVYKNGRINTGGNSYSGDGLIAISNNYIFFRPDNDSVYPDPPDYAVPRHFTVANIASSAWQRHQIYGEVSAPSGASNGHIWVQVANEKKDYVDIITRAEGYSFQYDSIILGLMIDNLVEGDSHQLYVDDIYVDNTQARVELCDGSQWSASLKCDPQIPSAWSGNSVTFTVNQGAFDAGDTAYIFVVDADGNVSNGLQVTVGD